MVPHRSTNRARACLTSLSRREAVLSCWYGRSQTNPLSYMFYNLLSFSSVNKDNPAVEKGGFWVDASLILVLVVSVVGLLSNERPLH